MDDYSDIRSFVLKIMEDDNLGVRELARAIGVSHPTVSELLATGKASLKTYKALAKYARMPLTNVLKIANVLSDPKSDEKTQEVVYIMGSLNEVNKEDVSDYAKMKLQKQERETKKNVKHSKVP